jgi:uncharacterized membrane protein YphA (DoxX/SURF4 family)
MSGRRIVYHLLRVALGAVFLYASVHKVLEPAEFSRTVYHYEILPAAAVNLVAIVLPWIEGCVGLCLILGAKVRGASAIAVVSLVLFLAAMGSALARGLNIDCGCFQAAGSKLGFDRIIGDLVLIAVAAFVYRESAVNPAAMPSLPGLAPSSIRVKESS